MKTPTKTLLSLAAAAILGSMTQAADINVKLDLDETGHPINPFIYGQFIEHLGRCIYGGIWAEMLEDRKFYFPITVDYDPYQDLQDTDFPVVGASPWEITGDSGGVIINTASTAGLRPRPGLTWYNASKGWAITATKSMAVELAPQKIRVNCLCPVAGETGMLHLFMGEDTPQMREKFISSVPLGRLSVPQDIANAALFLASPLAAGVTGVTMPVDAGLTAGSLPFLRDVLGVET